MESKTRNHASAAVPHSPRATGSFQAAAGTLLLADDEKSILGPIAAMLRSRGYRVITCENGTEAVVTYRESWRHIDLVILDMMMPGMNGGDAFVAMQETNPEVKGILLSGFGIDKRIQEVLSLGGIDFLQKPFRMADLIDRISRALGR